MYGLPHVSTYAPSILEINIMYYSHLFAIWGTILTLISNFVLLSIIII